MKHKVTTSITVFILAFLSYLFYYCAGGTLLGSILLLPIIIGFLVCYSIIFINGNYFASKKEWFWLAICIIDNVVKNGAKN